MRCYQRQHRFYCDADLHARTMATHVLDAQEKSVFERDLPTDPDMFLGAGLRNAVCLTGSGRRTPTRGQSR